MNGVEVVVALVVLVLPVAALIWAVRERRRTGSAWAGRMVRVVGGGIAVGVLAALVQIALSATYADPSQGEPLRGIVGFVRYAAGVVVWVGGIACFVGVLGERRRPAIR